jgi:Glycosyl hydrolase family 79, N-terminal domain
VLLLSLSIAPNRTVDGRESSVRPARMPKIAAVDARFQSYNVEMVLVTGGRFWRPYASGETAAEPNLELYSDRSPIDLANPRLRKLAAALAPAYVRISGTWANNTYFADSEEAPSAPPPGFGSVLTRARWHAVIDFARAANAKIVTSFAVSPGVRDRGGNWTTAQAGRLIAYTSFLEASIAAAEFMNEPSLASQNGAPSGYDAKAYGRDFRIFRTFLRKTSPATLIVGPGSIGESRASPNSSMRTSDLLRATGGGLDVFSYHHYATLSQRCGGRDRAEDILSEEWLSRTERALFFYRALRDQFVPKKPIWLTETADAACGGNPWDATFADTFRYLDQLGRLAKAGVKVVMHNTLSGSDYGLLDETTFNPRPDYWAALLWRRLMGPIVLDAAIAAQADLHVYAHCDPRLRGGVSLLVINTSRDTSHALLLPIESDRFTLHASDLESRTVKLNGKPLALDENDALPAILPTSAPAGAVTFEPATLTFLSMPKAESLACR